MDPTGLTAVNEQISEAARQAQRSDPIRLVVVVKYASDDQVDAVVAAGATDLGESRADALLARSARHESVTWHFIGRLQSNKARLVRAGADLLHSMDRPKLVAHWTRGDGVVPPVLIQVGGVEVLLDDSLTVAERIAGAGGDVTLQRWDEAIHVFQMLGAPESDEAITEIVAFVKGQL